MKGCSHIGRFFITTCIAVAAIGCNKEKEAPLPASFVNLFIGTDGTERSLEGRTHPGAQVPFGMVSVTPFNTYDTALATSMQDHRRMQAPYFKDRPHISGFSHVNLSGVGCPDLGVILLMPTTGRVTTQPTQYFSRFKDEVASPGLYSTTLTKYNVRAEVSATVRTGISRFTFPAGKSNILLNLGLGQTNYRGGGVKILSDTKLEGYRKVGNFCGAQVSQTVFFAMDISKSAAELGVWSGDSITIDRKDIEGDNVGAFFSFDTAEGEELIVKVGISYVSIANAWMNLEEEQKGFDFKTVKQSAREKWNEELAKIEVSGGTETDKIKFYTALYHTLVHPNIFNDANGEYPAMSSHTVKKAKGYQRYTVFSLWDTYRNLHQLFTLAYPGRQLDMLKSMVAMYEESGWLPKWELVGNETYVMVGDPATCVIADSYLKGIQQFDIDMAYEAMKKGALTQEQDNPLRPGIDAYMSYGFIPIDAKNQREVWGAVSTTLEYNVADFSLAQLAKRLGRKEDAEIFLQRSMGYKELFNPENEFLQPKLANGQWYEPLDTESSGWPGAPGYVEGNAWHYNFFVPHDIEGLMDLFDSKDSFGAKLQKAFDEGHFSMGNEPDIAYPFLFNYVQKQEWRAQKEVRNAIDEYYNTTPSGIPGNDDCGTMSAWLVFAMMGIYPDSPAKTNYQITSPVFDRVVIKLDPRFYAGDEFVISTTNNAQNNIYIGKMTLNGKVNNHYQIEHSTIVAGGKLSVDLINKPYGI